MLPLPFFNRSILKWNFDIYPTYEAPVEERNVVYIRCYSIRCYSFHLSFMWTFPHLGTVHVWKKWFTIMSAKVKLLNFFLLTISEINVITFSTWRTNAVCNVKFCLFLKQRYNNLGKLFCIKWIINLIENC